MADLITRQVAIEEIARLEQLFTEFMASVVNQPATPELLQEITAKGELIRAMIRGLGEPE
jgi:hypothetical protein